MKGGPKITYKPRLSKNINHLNIMKSYYENKLLGGALCENHIFFKCVCPDTYLHYGNHFILQLANNIFFRYRAFRCIFEKCQLLDIDIENEVKTEMVLKY